MLGLRGRPFDIFDHTRSVTGCVQSHFWMRPVTQPRGCVAGLSIYLITREVTRIINIQRAVSHQRQLGDDVTISCPSATVVPFRVFNSVHRLMLVSRSRASSKKQLHVLYYCVSTQRPHFFKQTVQFRPVLLLPVKILQF